MPRSIKIATYNVNGINGRLPVLLKWLEKSKPDIACLQELKASNDRFPEKALGELGYSAIWHGQASWNGVAILSRGSEPVEVQRGLRGNDDDDQSRYIEAAVKGILVVCLYVPNGNPAPGPRFSYKLDWLDRFQARAAELAPSGAPVVLAGDYNIIPSDFDVYAPERWHDDALFVPEVRHIFEALVASGWTDALRTKFPDEPCYTFWKYWRQSFERDAGLRIDHLLLNAELGSRLKRAGVDRWVRALPRSSDHAPAWIELSV